MRVFEECEWLYFAQARALFYDYFVERLLGHERGQRMRAERVYFVAAYDLKAM